MKRNRLTTLATGALLATSPSEFFCNEPGAAGGESANPQTGPRNQRTDDSMPSARNASPEVRQQLEQFRREIQEQNLSFTVGYTTALDRSMDELAGTRIPDDLADQYRRKNALLARNRDTDSKDHARVRMVDSSFRSSYSCNAAASFDRDQGKVSRPRSKGCGSCWALPRSVRSKEVICCAAASAILLSRMSFMQWGWFL